MLDAAEAQGECRRSHVARELRASPRDVVLSADAAVDERSRWKALAVQPIVEEAGGSFTDWQGTSTIHAGEGIATNGRVLEEVLAMTRGHS